MIQLDDIIKRSKYLNLSKKDQEFNQYHNRLNQFLESNIYSSNNIRFILQHWESIHENQVECFKKCVDLLDEAYDQDNINDFNYIKSYIINEVTPTVRDAKQSNRYIKYKLTQIRLLKIQRKT